MHVQNDLQATQHIITLFERSKSQSEEALEDLPGIYAVTNAEGTIFRANLGLATLLNRNLENTLGLNICKLLQESVATDLKKILSTFPDSKDSQSDFKVDIKQGDGQGLHYLWNISPLDTGRPDLPKLFSIVGRDVTELTRTTEEKTRMEMELVTARTVQESLFLPATQEFSNCSIAGYYQPSNECGGDWWHYRLIQDKLFLWIGDVTGHGVPAALVVSAVNSAVFTINEDGLTPSKALSHLNRVVSTTTKGKLAMTFFVASLDLKTFKCTYASAGHEAPILIPGKNEIAIRDLKLLDSDPCAPLGLSLDSQYKETDIELTSKDRLFLFTDGLRDVRNPKGQNWHNLKLHRVLAPLATKIKGSEDLINSVKSEMETFRDGTPLPDDATFMAFAIN